jgi:hypothetical protein
MLLNLRMRKIRVIGSSIISSRLEVGDVAYEHPPHLAAGTRRRSGPAEAAEAADLADALHLLLLS